MPRPRHDHARPRLLCVDEVGYLAYDSRYADLLFEIVTRRYEAHNPLAISTNKPFAEWSDVFPNAACVVTLVDRLIHRSELLEIEGKSYRLKKAKERAAAKRRKRHSAKSSRSPKGRSRASRAGSGSGVVDKGRVGSWRGLPQHHLRTRATV